MNFRLPIGCLGFRLILNLLNHVSNKAVNGEDRFNMFTNYGAHLVYCDDLIPVRSEIECGSMCIAAAFKYTNQLKTCTICEVSYGDYLTFNSNDSFFWIRNKIESFWPQVNGNVNRTVVVENGLLGKLLHLKGKYKNYTRFWIKMFDNQTNYVYLECRLTGNTRSIAVNILEDNEQWVGEVSLASNLFPFQPEQEFNIYLLFEYGEIHIYIKETCVEKYDYDLSMQIVAIQISGEVDVTELSF